MRAKANRRRQPGLPAETPYRLNRLKVFEGLAKNDPQCGFGGLKGGKRVLRGKDGYRLIIREI